MVITLNMYNNRLYKFPSTETPMERSLRKLRRKIRFNIAMGRFIPNFFTTLTLNPENFEEKMKKGPIRKKFSWLTKIIPETTLDKIFPEIRRKFDGSNFIREFFKEFQRKYGKIQYSWRAEVGKQGTKRLHFHILMQLKEKQLKMMTCEDSDLVTKLKCYNILKFHHSNGLERWAGCITQLWGRGICNVEKIQDLDKAMNYVTKYFSKNRIDEESDTVFRDNDPCLYCSRRWGVSRVIIPLPKSRWTLINPKTKCIYPDSMDIWGQNLEQIGQDIYQCLLMEQKPDNNRMSQWLNSEFHRRKDWIKFHYWFKHIGDYALHIHKLQRNSNMRVYAKLHSQREYPKLEKKYARVKFMYARFKKEILFVKNLNLYEEIQKNAKRFENVLI